MKPAYKTVRPDHWQRAKTLRRSATDAEKALWEAVRRNKLGPQFRRQHAMGMFIVDFFCQDARLIIEVDGDQHAEPDAVMYDYQRTGYLESRGYKVLRFSNTDVLFNTEMVLAEIKNHLPAP